MYKIGVKTHFDAAHLVRGYPGKCSSLHGHRWEVEAIFSGNVLDELDMLVDFSVVKKLVNEVILEFDHRNLVEIPPFDSINPTAESLAREIYHNLLNKINNNVRLIEVKVWESPECWASYW